MFYLLVIFPFYQFVINTLEYRFDIFCVLFQFCFCLTALNLCLLSQINTATIKMNLHYQTL